MKKTPQSPGSSLPSASNDIPLKGVAYMLLATGLLIPSLNAVAKVLMADYHVVQIAWARFAGHLLCMTLMFMPRFGLSLYRTNRLGAQLGRGAVMFASNSLFFCALPFVALATATAISFTTPLIITVLAVPLLGERIGIYRRIAVVTGLVGALIIVRPDFSDDSWSALLVLGAAFCFSLYQILTRRIAHVDPPETMIVYTAVVAAVVLSCIVPFYFRMPDTAQAFGLFVLLGFLGGISQYFVAKALSLAPASVIAPLAYAEIVSSTVFGIILFHSVPDLLTWVGAGVIVLSGLFLVYRERRLGRR